MTRFSEEYIAFVTNSAAIQRLWRERGVRAGDWFVWSDEEYPDDKNLDCFGGDETRDPELTINDLEDYGSVFWLPALDDLVGLLEQRLSTLTLTVRAAVKTNQYGLLRPRTVEGFGMVERSNHELLLPAARLLERVLAEEEGEDEI